MRLANHLRRCRFERSELTQDDLARAVGVTRQTILSIEKGRFVPSALLALKLARFFARPMEDVFYLTDDGESAGEDASR